MKKSRILSLILTVAMVVTMMTGFALAAGPAPTGKITISDAIEGKTYTAYKIFDVEVTGTGADAVKVYSIAKPADTDLITLLKGSSSPFALTEDGDKYLVAIKDKAANTPYSDKEIIDFIKANLSKFATTAAGTATGAAAGSTTEITGLAYGYYYVTSTTGSVISIDTLAGESQEIDEKNISGTPTWGPDPEHPSGTTDDGKFVKEDGEWVKANDATIGVDNEFVISAKAPKYVTDSKEVVAYKIADNFGEKFEDVKITSVVIDGKECLDSVYIKNAGTKADGKYPIAADKTSFEVVINVDKIGADYTDGNIFIYYTAKLTETANVGKEGNLNTATMNWTAVPYEKDHPYETPSNPTDPENPTNPEDPRTPEPPTVPQDPDDPFGPQDPNPDYPTNPDYPNVVPPTPSTTKTYTYAFALVKVDKADATKYLAGAEFTLTSGTTVLKFSYDDTAKKYTVSGAAAADSKITSVATATGVVISGLDAGDYTLTETKAPAGYSILKATETVTIAGGMDSAHDADAVELTETIQNAKGTTLPSTGGIGTTIFYIIGSVLVVGAVVLFITKKRMDANK